MAVPTEALLKLQTYKECFRTARTYTYVNQALLAFETKPLLKHVTNVVVLLLILSSHPPPHTAPLPLKQLTPHIHFLMCLSLPGAFLWICFLSLRVPWPHFVSLLSVSTCNILFLPLTLLHADTEGRALFFYSVFSSTRLYYTCLILPALAKICMWSQLLSKG